MVHPLIFGGSAIAGALLFSTAVLASPGETTGAVNMRTGPGTQYPIISTLPAGAPIEVIGCQSWCQIAYAGQQGYVSGGYVARGYGESPEAYYPPAPVYEAPPPVYFRPAPPPVVYWRDYRRPWYGYPRYHDYWWRHRGPGPGVYFEFGR